MTRICDQGRTQSQKEEGTKRRGSAASGRNRADENESGVVNKLIANLKEKRCNRDWSDGDPIRKFILITNTQGGRPGRTPAEPTHRPIRHRTGQKQDRNSNSTTHRKHFRIVHGPVSNRDPGCSKRPVDHSATTIPTNNPQTACFMYPHRKNATSKIRTHDQKTNYQTCFDISRYDTEDPPSVNSQIHGKQPQYYEQYSTARLHSKHRI